MKYFPLFADLNKAHVLVVGGGEGDAAVRLLRRPAPTSRSSPNPSLTSCARAEETNAI
jgi:siroheme synthase (precorrin-2 oxidase/ferrochelatase)